jgi:hypothetical protein
MKPTPPLELSCQPCANSSKCEHCLSARVSRKSLIRLGEEEDTLVDKIYVRNVSYTIQSIGYTAKKNAFWLKKPPSSCLVVPLSTSSDDFSINIRMTRKSNTKIIHISSFRFLRYFKRRGLAWSPWKCLKMKNRRYLILWDNHAITDVSIRDVEIFSRIKIKNEWISNLWNVIKSESLTFCNRKSQTQVYKFDVTRCMLKEIYYPLKSIIASSLIDILLYIDDNLPYSIYTLIYTYTET